MSFNTFATSMAWVAIVLLGFGMAAIVMQLSQIMKQQSQLQPEMNQSNLPGRLDSPRLTSIVPSQGALLIFHSAGCPACTYAVQAVQSVTSELSATPILVSRDEPIHDELLILGSAEDLFDKAAVRGTPTLVSVTADLQILEAVEVRPTTDVATSALQLDLGLIRHKTREKFK